MERSHQEIFKMIMKFQLPKNLKDRDRDIAKFLLHIDRVCKHHGISLSHEDHQGAFILENYNHNRRDWLWKAVEKFKHPIQPKKTNTPEQTPL
jgi:hypothetical protein